MHRPRNPARALSGTMGCSILCVCIASRPGQPSGNPNRPVVPSSHLRSHAQTPRRPPCDPQCDGDDDGDVSVTGHYSLAHACMPCPSDKKQKTCLCLPQHASVTPCFQLHRKLPRSMYMLEAVCCSLRHFSLPSHSNKLLVQKPRHAAGT